MLLSLYNAGAKLAEGWAFRGTMKKAESKLVVCMLTRYMCSIAPARSKHFGQFEPEHTQAVKHVITNTGFRSLLLLYENLFKTHMHMQFLERRSNPQGLEKAWLPKAHLVCHVWSAEPLQEEGFFVFNLWCFILIVVLHLIEMSHCISVMQHLVWYIP